MVGAAQGLEVSVVIATYRSTTVGLERVTASLDAQTLDPSRFEVIFVDDGSPDDTVTRLHDIAASRPHVRVLQVPHSGWGCVPRNAGIEAARGEYVLFMDHDDSLFPDALERGAAFGRSNGSDIVNCREVRSSGTGWAFDVYQRDLERPAKHLMSLQPMLPHRFYRRRLLIDHDVRFPVGGRVLWEDNYFNVSAYVHADVVSVLSSVPSYVWHVGSGGNLYDTFEQDPAEYWEQLDRLFGFFAETLTDPADLAWLRRRTYQLRVLGLWVGPAALQRPAAIRDRAYASARAIATAHVPPDLDADLPKQAQAWSYLLRSGRDDALVALAEVERGTSAVGSVERFDWSPAGLVIDAAATWQRPAQSAAQPGDPGPTPVPATDQLFRRDGSRLLRILTPDLDEALPLGIRDVAAELDQSSAVVTWHRRGGVQAEIGTAQIDAAQIRTASMGTGERADGHRVVEQPGAAGASSVSQRVRAELDPDADVFGHPLADGTYDFSLRVAFMGHVAHRRLRASGPSRTALVRGRVAMAYADRAGFLALQLSRSVARVLVESRPDWIGARIERRSGGGHRLRLPLGGLLAIGATTLECRLILSPVPAGTEDQPANPPGEVFVTAQIVGEAGRVHLVADLDPAAGASYRLLVVDEAGLRRSTGRVLRSLRSYGIGPRRLVVTEDEHHAAGADSWR